MKRIRSALLGPAIGLAAMAGALSSQAAPIDRWVVTLTNDWSDVTFIGGPNTVAPANPFSMADTLPDGSNPRNLTYDIISWGTPLTEEGRSFLAVDDMATFGGLTTGDSLGVPGVNFYHGNYRQSATTNGSPPERWLDNATLNVRIALTPEGAESSARTFEHSIPIDFRETRNTSSIQSCAGTPWASSTTPCPDSLTILDEAANFPFVFDGVSYVLSFAFDPANSLNLTRLDQNEDSSTAWTNEGVRSRLATRLLIRAAGAPAPIPEPGTLGIALAGLALLAVARRTRRA